MSTAKYAGLPDIVTFSSTPRANCIVHTLSRTRLRMCTKRQTRSPPPIRTYATSFLSNAVSYALARSTPVMRMAPCHRAVQAFEPGMVQAMLDLRRARS